MMLANSNESILANYRESIYLESVLKCCTFVTVFRKVLNLTKVRVFNAVGMRIPSKERRTRWQYFTDYRRLLLLSRKVTANGTPER